MIKAGVIGGAGYTAGELIRILVHHPEVKIEFVNSASNAGNPITAVHGGLIGETGLIFTDELPLGETDVLFLCSAHGDSRKFLAAHEVPENVRKSIYRPIFATNVMITILCTGFRNSTKMQSYTQTA